MNLFALEHNPRSPRAITIVPPKTCLENHLIIRARKCVIYSFMSSFIKTRSRFDAFRIKCHSLNSKLSRKTNCYKLFPWTYRSEVSTRGRCHYCWNCFSRYCLPERITRKCVFRLICGDIKSTLQKKRINNSLWLKKIFFS